MPPFAAESSRATRAAFGGAGGIKIFSRCFRRGLRYECSSYRGDGQCSSVGGIIGEACAPRQLHLRVVLTRTHVASSIRGDTGGHTVEVPA